MILIVGGAGYIGSHTNKLLNKRGYKTVVFDNLSSGHREFTKWGDFVLGDLSDRAQIAFCFENYPIKSVMHFSAFAYVGESVVDPEKYYLNNVSNTLNLLGVMKDFDVKYLIFSSTSATYGTPKKIPITEDHVQCPISPYGKSKLMIEEILKDYDRAYGFKHINLRYFNAAGADPDSEIGERHVPETHLIPLTIHTAMGLKKYAKIFGSNYSTRDGTCIRDYVHVVDLADAHIKALDYLVSENKSDVFNLGNNIGYSVREIIERIREISKTDFKTIEGRKREGDAPVLISSNEKVFKMLNWKPEFSQIDTIIETAWRWHNTDKLKDR